MHIRRTLGSMVPEVVILLSYIGTYVQRPAAVFPYPHVPAALKQAPCCHWRRSYHQSQSPIESMHTRHPLETPLPSSSAAVCFLDCCLSSHAEYESSILQQSWSPSSRSRTPGAYEASSPNCLWRQGYCCFSSRPSTSQRPSVQSWSNGEHSFRKRSISALVSLAMHRDM